MDRDTRNVFIILICLVVPLFLKAQNVQELFLRGNKAYKQKQWQEAFDLYHSIEKKGRAVWYNMGNSLYRLNDYAHAIVCWKRSIYGSSLSELFDISKNITLAHKKLEKPMQGGFLMMTEQWSHVLPVLPIQLLFLLCWNLFWFIGIGIIQCKKRFFYFLVIGLAVLMIPLGNVLLEKYYIQRDIKGIVVTKESPLLAGPHMGYHVVGTVSLADELLVCEKRSGWCKVSGHQGYGWIQSSNLEII